MKNERLRVWIGLLTISLVWGSTWLAIKIGLESVPPFIGVGLRFLTASIILFVIVRIRGIALSFTAEARRLYATLVMFSYGIPFALVYWAEQYLPSSLGSILFAAFPFWVALFSHALLPTEKLTMFKLGGVVLGFTGLLIIFSGDVHWSSGTLAFMAMSAVVVSTIMQALATVIMRKHGHGANPFALNCVGMFFAGSLLLLLGLATESFSSITWDEKAIGSILYLAVIGSIVAFVTYYWLLKRIEAVYLSLTTFVNPIVAVILGAIILDETLAPKVLLGASFVLLGILVANGKYFYEKLFDAK